LLISAAFGSLDRSLTANGVGLRSGERHTVLSGATGVVAEIPARVNDKIDKDELMTWTCKGVAPFLFSDAVRGCAAGAVPDARADLPAIDGLRR